MDPNFDLISAADIGDLMAVDALLADPYVDPVGVEGLALRKALERGHMNVVRRILAAEKPFRHGWTAFDRLFLIAADKGYMGLVRLLLPSRLVESAGEVYHRTRNAHAKTLLLPYVTLTAEVWASEVLQAAVSGHDDFARALLRDERFFHATYTTGRRFEFEPMNDVIYDMLAMRLAICEGFGPNVSMLAMKLVNPDDVLVGAKYAAAIGAGPMLELILERFLGDRPLTRGALAPVGKSAVHVWETYLSWTSIRSSWIGSVMRALPLRPPSPPS